MEPGLAIHCGTQAVGGATREAIGIYIGQGSAGAESSANNMFFSFEEFASELTSSWPLARVEGRVWAALLRQDPANPPNRS